MAKMKQARVAAKAASATKAPEPSFDNRRARFEYEKMESLEVGIALTGTGSFVSRGPLGKDGFGEPD